MSFEDWLQRANSSKSSDSLQGLSSSASCSAPTTSAASRPTSKQKSADANDLGVDDSKQVILHAYFIGMFGAKKDASILCSSLSEVGLAGIFCEV